MSLRQKYNFLFFYVEGYELCPFGIFLENVGGVDALKTLLNSCSNEEELKKKVKEYV